MAELTANTVATAQQPPIEKDGSTDAGRDRREDDVGRPLGSAVCYFAEKCAVGIAVNHDGKTRTIRKPGTQLQPGQGASGIRGGEQTSGGGVHRAGHAHGDALGHRLFLQGLLETPAQPFQEHPTVG
jgi:hypothetical protein